VNDAARGNPLTRFFRTATRIESNELTATLLSFFFMFALMLAYNIMKPVRDAMAPDWSDAALAWLWTYNFFFSAVAVALYGFAVSRLRLKYLIPGVYGFFATSFVLFYFGSRLLEDATFVDKAFYLWISLFSLFHISVFWSLMSDLFSKTQALRLFAFIASAASIGTIAGSSATLVLAKALGTMNLMLIAAVILVAIVPIIGVLYRFKTTRLQPDIADAEAGSETVVSGNPFAGFREFVRNPFLLGIALFIFLYTIIGSFAYFEIKNLLEDLDRDAVFEEAELFESFGLIEPTGWQVSDPQERSAGEPVNANVSQHGSLGVCSAIVGNRQAAEVEAVAAVAAGDLHDVRVRDLLRVG
jgi:AAA family ATP:ADP antiporter